MMRRIVLEENVSNLTTSVSGEASASSSSRNEAADLYPPPHHHQQSLASPNPAPSPPPKKKRNLPGNPDPEAEVIALSPKTLQATNRFVCEICNKGFQRDQNLQLHRRGHNLPWKLKQRANKEQVRKKVYVCPEPTCVHHDPSRALGDLTGIKKHFSRKHGEKKWKCDKCSKRYAVQSDWKAHSKICGTREYRCDCGTLFSRRDSFITHRAFCDALGEESARTTISTNYHPLFPPSAPPAAATPSSSSLPPPPPPPQFNNFPSLPIKSEQEPAPWLPPQQQPLQQQPLLSSPPPQNFDIRPSLPPWLACPPSHLPLTQAGPGPPAMNNEAFSSQRLNPNPSHHMSATALLQKAAEMGVTMSNKPSSTPATASSCGSQLVILSGPQNQAHVTTETGLGSREMIGSQSSSGFGTVTSGFIEHDGMTSAGLLLHMHDVMMSSLNSPSGFDGSSFEDAFGGLVNPNGVEVHGGGGSRGNASGISGGGGSRDDSLTRDFLGLRSLSRKDFITMAGFDHVTSSLNSSEQQNRSQNENQNHTPWQG